MIIINLSKPSLVSTARYLPITVSSTIKVAYDHTRIVYIICTVYREVIWLTARRRQLVWERVNIEQCWGSSQVAPFFLGCAEQCLCSVADPGS
jgi:hypothetical protein